MSFINALIAKVPIKIGRSFKNDTSLPENGYFDCKVLSKAHAMILYEDGRFMLIDTGSSNGTFVNNIRLRYLFNTKNILSLI